MGEWKCNFSHAQTQRLIEVICQLHTPAALSTEKEPLVTIELAGDGQTTQNMF
jgi:hypothetical protein